MGPLTRSLLNRLNFWVLATLLFVFSALLYAVLNLHNARFDLTKNRRFSLSSKSLEILKGLGPGTIRAKAFFRSDQEGREVVEDLFKLYRYHCPALQYEFLDPDRNPGQAKLYGVDEYGVVILERDGKRERAQEINEEAFTNALLKLTQSRVKTLAFVKGHGEKILANQRERGYSQFKARLEAENFRIREFLLARDPLPEDADLVIVAGPVTDFLEPEIRLLKQYAEKGGKLLLLLDPIEVPLGNFEKWLETYDVVLGQNVVVDKLSRLFGADYVVPVVTQYGKHPIAEKLRAASFLPFTRSVTPKKDGTSGLKVTELASTSQGSWAEQDWREIEQGKVTLDEGDLPGPVSLAVAVQDEKSGMRLAVFGDSDFADNAHLYLSGNKDLILNAVAWLSGEEKLVTIRDREKESNLLVLSQEQQRWIFLVPVVLMPLMSIGTGLGVLFYRKRFA